MARTTIALAALCGVLAGGLAMSLLDRPTGGMDEAQVRALVTDVLAQDTAQPEPALAAETLNPMIESYLMGNPRILERVTAELQTQVRNEAQERARTAIASAQDALYNDPDHIVLGNPEGDVTLIEMFDYNCTYCRQALPTVATLLAEDPELRIILKEFPILSQESVDAAHIAVAVGRTDADYWQFHESLFTARGQVTGQTAMDAARELGLNPVTLQLEAESESVNAALRRSYDLAQELGISGTPTFIIGDEIIPGAVGIDQLRQRIANMRACGKTVCEG